MVGDIEGNSSEGQSICFVILIYSLCQSQNYKQHHVRKAEGVSSFHKYVNRKAIAMHMLYMYKQQFSFFSFTECDYCKYVKFRYV